MTIKSEYIKQEFIRELRSLFDRYNAEITAKDYYSGYAECGENIKMVVDIPAFWDKDGNLIQEGAEIDMGSWFDKDKKL